MSVAAAGTPLYAPVKQLMQATSGHNHQKHAHKCGDSDRQPLSRYHVEIKHERNTGRHEEERHIPDQETAHRGYGLRSHHPLAEQDCQEQHTQDTARYRHTRYHGEQLAPQQTPENYSELFCHHNLCFVQEHTGRPWPHTPCRRPRSHAVTAPAPFLQTAKIAKKTDPHTTQARLLPPVTASFFTTSAPRLMFLS